MNTDGDAERIPGPTSGGGIIPDSQGKMHYAFSANFGYCSAFYVEMKTIEISIDLAKRMGIQKINDSNGLSFWYRSTSKLRTIWKRVHSYCSSVSVINQKS